MRPSSCVIRSYFPRCRFLFASMEGTSGTLLSHSLSRIHAVHVASSAFAAQAETCVASLVLSPVSLPLPHKVPLRFGGFPWYAAICFPYSRGTEGYTLRHALL